MLATPLHLLLQTPSASHMHAPNLSLKHYESHSSWIETLRLCSNWPLYPLVASCLPLGGEKEGRETKTETCKCVSRSTSDLTVSPIGNMDALVSLVAKISSCLSQRHTHMSSPDLWPHVNTWLPKPPSLAWYSLAITHWRAYLLWLLVVQLYGSL